MNKSSIVAVFDLDGTITFKDTFLEFIKCCNGKMNYYIGLLYLSPQIILYYIKLISNDRLKEIFFSHYLKDKSILELHTRGDEFSESTLPKLCRESALDVLKWHQNENHDIIILSASSDIWLKKWCDLNGFKLICTKFEKKDDFYIGKILGKNCFGTRKKQLLKDILVKYNYSFSYGYGDSKSDKYFLELVDQSYLMTLSPKNVNKYWNK